MASSPLSEIITPLQLKVADGHEGFPLHGEHQLRIGIVQVRHTVVRKK
jgi:hypothetical protein